PLARPLLEPLLEELRAAPDRLLGLAQHLRAPGGALEHDVGALLHLAREAAARVLALDAQPGLALAGHGDHALTDRRTTAARAGPSPRPPRAARLLPCSRQPSPGPRGRRPITMCDGRGERRRPVPVWRPTADDKARLAVPVAGGKRDLEHGRGFVMVDRLPL